MLADRKSIGEARKKPRTGERMNRVPNQGLKLKGSLPPRRTTPPPIEFPHFAWNLISHHDHLDLHTIENLTHRVLLKFVNREKFITKSFMNEKDIGDKNRLWQNKLFWLFDVVT